MTVVHLAKPIPATAADVQPRHWAFSIDALPPSVNKMHGYNATTGHPYVTAAAEAIRDWIRREARNAGFEPSLKHCYGVIVVYIMPDYDSLDVDNGLKAALDSALSSRTDHRVIHLLVDKRVRPGQPPRTDIEVWRVAADSTLVGWLRELLAREDAP